MCKGLLQVRIPSVGRLRTDSSCFASTSRRRWWTKELIKRAYGSHRWMRRAHSSTHLLQMYGATDVRERVVCKGFNLPKRAGM